MLAAANGLDERGGAGEEGGQDKREVREESHVDSVSEMYRPGGQSRPPPLGSGR
jgi:hypothetical protein